MSAPPGGERAGQDTERLVEIDVADELKLDVVSSLLLLLLRGLSGSSLNGGAPVDAGELPSAGVKRLALKGCERGFT